MKTLSRYTSYFTCTIRHSYFAAGKPLNESGMRIEPAPETAQILAANGFVIRPSAEGFAIVGRPNHTLPDQMRFFLIADDSALFKITGHDGAPLPPDKMIVCHVCDGAAQARLIARERTEPTVSMLGHLVVDAAQTGLHIDWFLPSPPVNHVVVVTGPNGVDLSECRVKRKDGTAVHTIPSDVTLPDGHTAKRLEIDGLFPLHESPSREERLVLCYKSSRGSIESMLVPLADPRAITMENGVPTVTVYIRL